MSVKITKRKLYIQNLTNGEITYLPYWDSDECNFSLQKEVLWYELCSMLQNTDNVKIFYTYN